MLEINEWGSDIELCDSADDEPCYENGSCLNCSHYKGNKERE